VETWEFDARRIKGEDDKMRPPTRWRVGAPGGGFQGREDGEATGSRPKPAQQDGGQARTTGWGQGRTTGWGQERFDAGGVGRA